ncbi:MAG: hypothetical protein VX730_07640 [Pseudomonadota bacterium]|nr:hypothetical protein [Pseudomonadota bacterium]
MTDVKTKADIDTSTVEGFIKLSEHLEIQREKRLAIQARKEAQAEQNVVPMEQEEDKSHER